VKAKCIDEKGYYTPFHNVALLKKQISKLAGTADPLPKVFVDKKDPTGKTVFVGKNQRLSLSGLQICVAAGMDCFKTGVGEMLGAIPEELAMHLQSARLLMPNLFPSTHEPSELLDDMHESVLGYCFLTDERNQVGRLWGEAREGREGEEGRREEGMTGVDLVLVALFSLYVTCSTTLPSSSGVSLYHLIPPPAL
jgi:hypothetical protein